jgi:hypothetical protein
VSRRCPRCSDPVEQKALGGLSGEKQPLVLRLEGMPAMRCAKGHAMPVHRDFMLWLIQELKARAMALPAASEKGLLMKTYRCACGAELGAASGRRAFSFDLAFEAAPAFRAEIEMPVFKCPACGKEQLRSGKEAPSRVASAIVAINDAAGFPHSG